MSAFFWWKGQIYDPIKLAVHSPWRVDSLKGDLPAKWPPVIFLTSFWGMGGCPGPTSTSFSMTSGEGMATELGWIFEQPVRKLGWGEEHWHMQQSCRYNSYWAACGHSSGRRWAWRNSASSQTIVSWMRVQYAATGATNKNTQRQLKWEKKDTKW